MGHPNGIGQCEALHAAARRRAMRTQFRFVVVGLAIELATIAFLMA